MGFDHQAATKQIASIVKYAGISFIIEGDSRECRGLLDRETGTADLGEYGYTESIEARITVSSVNFPTPPKFGSVIYVCDDGSRYSVGHSERVKGGWEVHLKALDLSTPQSS